MSRTKKDGVYYERHHVIPRSMGGTDDRENLVVLTAREHFLAHWLLWRIHRNISTAFAFKCMIKFTNRKQCRYKGFSSIAYEESKIAVSTMLSGVPKSESSKLKQSNSMKGKNTYKRSTETKQKMSVSRTGISRTDITKQKISESKQGKSFSEEHKNNLSKFNVGTTGLKFSTDTKLLMSISQIERYKKYENGDSPLKGKKRPNKAPMKHVICEYCGHLTTSNQINRHIQFHHKKNCEL